ncbi:hypothetical protein BDZ94DRAFT_858982 [Collybia nuda]|uniref:DUF6534 domain-containing protein n=1 Tax=Collybia nuda TaxID=64659 RepID=A0A9P6CCV6_9AGAR|nr:hypothetical protein BDZ94DRAFT_858982 [Collybia nuda]
MADPLVPIPADVNKSTAPLLIGYILNWGLYGGLCVQSYYYYVAFPKDRLVLKCLVYGLLLVETAQSILIAHDIFTIFSTGYGNIAVLIDPQLSWLSVPIMTGIVSCTVQIYFSHRIHIISGSQLARIIIILLALMQGIAAIVGGAQLLISNDLTKVQVKAHTSTTIWLVGSAVCDIIIAVFMVFFLSRRATGFKATQTLITKVMRLTIETGSLTATVAIIDVILFLAFPESNFHVAPAFILGKLYSNTLVTTLNSRLLIVNSRNDTPEDINSYRLESSPQFGSFVDNTQRLRGTNLRSRKDETVLTVNIEREIWKANIPMDNLDASLSGTSSYDKRDHDIHDPGGISKSTGDRIGTVESLA